MPTCFYDEKINLSTYVPFVAEQKEPKVSQRQAFGNPACQKREFDKRYIFGIVRYGRKQPEAAPISVNGI